MGKVSSILVGVAGEYFAAAELSRRGYIASITLRNTKGVDIIATNEAASKTINIQVKTSSGSSRGGWILNKKAEQMSEKNLFYIFVKIPKDNQNPLFHIVPSKDLASVVKAGHKKWLETLGKKGQKHNDSNMRYWRDEDNKYLDKWDLLGLD
jgi:hypothetical protein